jgi:hypothetical protein
MTVDVKQPLNDPAYVRLVAELTVASAAQRQRVAETDLHARRMRAKLEKKIATLPRRAADPNAIPFRKLAEDADVVAAATQQLWLRTERALLALGQAHGLPRTKAPWRWRRRPLPVVMAEAQTWLPPDFEFIVPRGFPAL